MGQGAAALIIGGSNANRLTAAFTDLGKKVETISGGGWKITADSVVTPYSLLRDMLAELSRIVDACGNHPVMILEAVPRFLIRSCCMDLQHCANIKGADPASVGACKKIMEDLATLNSRVGEFLQSEHVTMVRTGDLLTGRDARRSTTWTPYCI